jgi:TOMM system kinase/cyclase fusion protein
MSFAADKSLQVGSVFQGRYEVLGELGAGTFGRVYRARQLSTGQDVAVKVLAFRHGDPSNSDGSAERFRREMRLCVELFHPNIVHLVDSGETEDGTLYAAFEYVPGSTLKQVLSEEGKLTLQETVHLMSQVLDALSAAHARGVVHRDLKPENIMITRTGTRRNAMVLDFGLSGFAPEATGWGLPRITATQEMMGTPCYAAPEQLRGESPTTRSDLYSWGLIFLECLSGELVVRGASVHESIVKQLSDEPIDIPAALPERLRKLLQVVTAKAVEKRDATIAGLFQTMSAVQPGWDETEPDVSVPQQKQPGERRQVTVLSCWLAVSQSDGRVVDLEQLDELVHAQDALYAELAARGGGRVATAFGNQAIFVFGHPQAHEDDARRAARTALRIRDEVRRRDSEMEREHGIRLEVRIGIHTGLVIVRELRRPAVRDSFDLIGPTPQVATRLAEMAEAGEVLASGDTQRLLRSEIESEPRGEARLPGGGDTVPVFSLKGLRQLAAGVETIQLQRETLLVGRDQQLEQLVDAWRRTQAGSGAVFLVSGEPGIGKSRLVRELRRRVPAAAWLGCQCRAENQNSALRPFIDLLSALDEPIEALLSRYEMDLAENLPLLNALVSLPPDERYPLPNLTPERRKELTLNAILTLLVRMAAAQPLILAMEDLHWADPTTLDLLAMLVEELRAPVQAPDEVPRICVVTTARPVFTPPWSLENVSLIVLPRLTGNEVEEMIKASLTSDVSALPRRVLDEVILRSDGIPLFAEEVTRMLVESGIDPESDSNRLNMGIPGTLRDLLTARLDGLSSSAKDTAQLASVLGREFRYELLRAASEKTESLVRADVRELSHAGLIYQRRSVRAESYLFKHALLRDTAYESMVRTSRQTLHERVANVLHERFPDVKRTQPEVLAFHFQHGGRAENALEYWRQAGDLAVKRGAYVESIRHSQEGLHLLEGLSESPWRNTTELELRTSLGVGLIATKGYGAAEVEQNCSRAQDLCNELRDAPQLVPTLYGLWTYHLLRDHRDASLELAERLYRIAQSPEHVLIATTARGITAYWGAEYKKSLEYLDHASALYDAKHQRALAPGFGEDAALLAPLYRTWCLMAMGNFDQARAQQGRTQALVAQVSSPYVTATWMIFGLLLGLGLEDVALTRSFAEGAIALSQEQRFPFFFATASCGYGWTQIMEGEIKAGIARIREGLGVLQLTGAVVARSYWLACIAEGQLALGEVAAGLVTVDEALAQSEGNLNRLQDPWLYRLKGELLQLTSDTASAEHWLRKAVTSAHERGAKPLELRAVMSLARFLSTQGKAGDVRPLVADVAQSFTEGADTGPVRAVRALLAELT